MKDCTQKEVKQVEAPHDYYLQYLKMNNTQYKNDNIWYCYPEVRL